MVKSNFDFKNIDSSTRLINQFESILKEGDRLLIIATVSYFIIGFLIAPFYNTWLLSLLFGGINFFFLILAYARKNTRSLLRTYFSLGLPLFAIQFILQTEGNLFLHLFLCNTAFFLIILQNRRYILPSFITIAVFYLVLATLIFLNSASKELLLSIPTTDNLKALLFLPLPMAQMILGMFALMTFHKKNIRKSLQKAVFIEEKLNVNANTELALEIAKGKLNTEYNLVEGDVLGDALLTMRNSLLEFKERDQIQKWSNTGIASVNELLLVETRLENLCRKVLRELIHHLKSSHGSIYIAEKTNDNADEVLKLYACYAGNKRQKVGEYTITPGEGLVGEAFIRGEFIETNKIGDNFEFIHSGLGEAKPKAVSIVPLNIKNKAIGIIEVASFQEFTNVEKQFLQSVSESIAVTISTLINAQRTQSLLEETQKFNEQVKIQEESMKKAFLEINSIEEQFLTSKAELLGYRSIFSEKINELKGILYQVKEKELTLLAASDYFTSLLGINDTKTTDIKSLIAASDITTLEQHWISDEKLLTLNYSLHSANFSESYNVKDFSISIAKNKRERKRLGLIQRVE